MRIMFPYIGTSCVHVPSTLPLECFLLREQRGEAENGSGFIAQPGCIENTGTGTSSACSFSADVCCIFSVALGIPIAISPHLPQTPERFFKVVVSKGRKHIALVRPSSVLALPIPH
jgi:hypothetical protein